MSAPIKAIGDCYLKHQLTEIPHSQSYLSHCSKLTRAKEIWQKNELMSHHYHSTKWGPGGMQIMEGRLWRRKW